MRCAGVPLLVITTVPRVATQCSLLHGAVPVVVRDGLDIDKDALLQTVGCGWGGLGGGFGVGLEWTGGEGRAGQATSLVVMGGPHCSSGLLVQTLQVLDITKRLGLCKCDAGRAEQVAVLSGGAGAAPQRVQPCAAGEGQAATRRPLMPRACPGCDAAGMRSN
jgi:hypothetical protein